MAQEQTCTLCDLPVAETPVANDAGEPFCCRGCREVHRELATHDELTVEDDPTDLAADEDDVPAEYETTHLQIEGMHCTTCETFIESRAADQDGVGAVDASYITDTVRIDHDPEVSTDTFEETLTGLGYRAYPRGDPLGERQATDQILMRLVVGLVFGMFIMMPYIVLIYPTYFGGLWYPPSQAEFLVELLSGASATPLYYMLGIFSAIVLFYTGGPILTGAYVSLRARAPNMDLLIALAATSAWLYSTVAVFVESGIPHLYYDVTVGIILVVTGGTYYENRIKRRATDKLAGLTQAQVDEATLYDADGSTTTVPVADLTAGDRVLVREGERIPVDGVVADGEGAVDEAVVTGESLPVSKAAGDEVVGGSVLQDGSLVVEVGEGAQSSIDRITDVVWNLQSANHGIQQLADKLATIFVPVVLTLGLVVGVAQFALGAGFSTALLVALTVLIVSCPCALGLATPLAVATSVREALERGIVVFDETIFERLRGVDLVVFDKTGTLTTGEMQVLDAEGPDDVFEKAALLEDRTAHPVGAALVAAFGPDDSPPESDAVTDGGVTAESGAASESPPEDSRVQDFQSHPKGVSGTVDDVAVLVGHPDLFGERDWTVPNWIGDRATQAREEGAVPVLVGTDGTADGIAVVGDEPRENWDDVVSALGDRGIEVALLTGDERQATTTFEAHPDIDRVFAGVPPEAKAETVARLGADKQTVMVGDGTNDAPALATADLGIALGSGTALAADAADVAIITDDLASLETTFDLAAAANRRIKQNIGWAFCYNGVAIPLAVTGLLNPLFAALAMATSSLLVVTNSARELLP
jgi:Cu2+-exporting ATPase